MVEIKNISMGSIEMSAEEMEKMEGVAASIYIGASEACQAAGLRPRRIHQVLAAAALMSGLVAGNMHPEHQENISVEIMLPIYHGLKMNGKKVSDRITVRTN